MFYNITKQIIKPLVNLFLLVQGAAFGLFILQKYSPNDHFENPDKSFVKVNIRYVVNAFLFYCNIISDGLHICSLPLEEF